MRGQLNLLVAPLGRSVLAGDQPGSVDAAKIAINERVSALGLIIRFVVKAEVPISVVVPGMALQELILVCGFRLSFAPVTVENVLARVDQLASVSDCALVDGIRGHEISMRTPTRLAQRRGRPLTIGLARMCAKAVQPSSFEVVFRSDCQTNLLLRNR